MGIQVPAQRIRFAVDVSKWPSGIGSAPTDVISGTQVQIANGADLQIELIFSDGALADSPTSTVLDFTNIASVVVALMQPTNPHGSGIYWEISTPNASLTACTAAQWNAAQPNTNAQLTVLVPNALNSFNLSANTNQPFWICVYGVTSDATPKQVPYCFFPVQIVDTGMPATNPALPQPFKVGSTLAFVCSDGLTRNLSIQQAPNGLWTVNVNQVGYNGPGQASYSFFCTDNLWRDVSLTLQQGVWTINIGQVGHT